MTETKIDAGIHVVATDLETGETSEAIIRPGDYVLVAAEPCRLAHEEHRANGTVILTLKDRTPKFASTVRIEHRAADRD